jgi:OAA-family lectin sugar binding domain
VATYRTQIQWGGPDAAWHDDTNLIIYIQNRKAVVPDKALPPTGTQVSWSGPEGNASITFFDNGTSFQGAAQFPGEGPVGYRGHAQ